MERRALVALLTSLKMTKAWPLIFRLRETRISRIWPNWEKMAYRDFFSSAGGGRKAPVGDWRSWYLVLGVEFLFQSQAWPRMDTISQRPRCHRSGIPKRKQHQQRPRITGMGCVRSPVCTDSTGTCLLGLLHKVQEPHVTKGTR